MKAAEKRAIRRQRKALIQEIAKGEGFDLVDAIRGLAVIVAALSDAALEIDADDPAPAPPPDSESVIALADVVPPPPLETLLNVKLAGVLAKAGYTTPEQLIAATNEQLLQISGVSDKTISLIREKVG